MARIVVIGAGVVGLGAAMLLAGDGHQVVVLERDPAPPPNDPAEAWRHWQRPGVNQFRLPHGFLAGVRSWKPCSPPRPSRPRAWRFAAAWRSPAWSAERRRCPASRMWQACGRRLASPSRPTWWWT